MTVFLFNTLIIPIDFDKATTASIVLRKISPAEARRILVEAEESGEGVVSAVGHEATAGLMTRILDFQTRFERKTVFMKPGDRGIHFFLKARLPEGKVLTEDELKELQYWLVLSEVVEQ